MRLSITGGRQNAELVLTGLREALPTGAVPGAPCQAQLLPIRKEGIVIPSEVSFTAVCGNVHAYSGDLRIACRAASLGHYWNEIRVQGGAYGTGLLVRETGLVSAYTYRDPDCRRSRGAIGRTAAYLEAAAASGEAQDVNIIGAISDAEPLLSPRLQGAVADTWLLKGMTQADRCRLRHKMLDTLPEQLAAVLEREIEEALVKDVTKLLLELGTGFAFLGNQYHLNVGGDDFYIDLLFYNLNLRCYVVIELKTGEFKPEYAGQLNFYLSAVDGILKKEQDNPSVGLLLCKSKNDLVAEYSLKDMSKPIGVSAYQVTSKLPEELEKQLPSVEDIQKRIK